MDFETPEEDGRLSKSESKGAKLHQKAKDNLATAKRKLETLQLKLTIAKSNLGKGREQTAGKGKLFSTTGRTR